MTEIRFYHLKRKSLDQALPEILEKALERGYKAVIKHKDESALKQLNDTLWTFRPNSFIPHGMKPDQYAENQPVWLTTEDETPNDADLLVVTGGAEPHDLSKFKLCVEFLEDHDQDAIKASRQRWKSYKDDGLEISYWEQTAEGRWSQKA